MNNPIKTGIIAIENLPEDFIIDVNKEFKEKIFITVKKHFRGWSRLSKELNLSYRLFNGNKYRYKPKQLRFFKKICIFLRNKGYCQFRLKKLEKNIIFLKSHYGNKGIKNPKLPFNLNTYNGGCLISSLLHDGSIKSSLTVNYCNKKEELINKFIKISKNCFGDVHYHTNRFTVLLPKIIGELLTRCFGMKSGKKTVTDAHVPKFAFKSNKDFISGYLNFTISDDGSIGINLNHNIYVIRIGLYKDITNFSKELRENIKNNCKKYWKYTPNILKADKRLMKNLGISVNGPFYEQEYKYIDKNNKQRTSFCWFISITNLIDIEKFYKNVKLTHSEKQKRLEKIMKIASRGYRQYKKGNVFKEVLIHCNKLLSGDKLITASILSKSLNRSLGRTQWILKRMVENNLIEKIGETPKNCEYIYKSK